MGSLTSSGRCDAQRSATLLRGPLFGLLEELRTRSVASAFFVYDQYGQLGRGNIGLELAPQVCCRQADGPIVDDGDPDRIDAGVEVGEAPLGLWGGRRVPELRQERSDTRGVLGQSRTNQHAFTLTP